MTKEKQKESNSSPSVEDGVFGGKNDSEEFFSNLEANSNTNTNTNQATSANEPNSGDEGKEGKSVEEQIEALTKKIERTEKRYGDSSREAIKLRTQLNELEPFMPIFDKMKEQPALVDHMIAKIKEGERPASPKEALGLDDDFVFDPEEAISDINSDSAKVLRYMGKVEADKIVKETDRKNQSLRATEKEQENFDNFVKSRNLTEKDTDELKQFMREYRMSLDDVYLLMRKGDFAKNIAKKSREETLKQINAARALNGDSLGTRESELFDTSDDDKAFDEFFGKRESGLFS